MAYSKKPFRIGKNKPGRNQPVYLGKAQKIKETLIHKAKLKKQRAKELAKAGYGNDAQPQHDNNDTNNSDDDTVNPHPRKDPANIETRDGQKSSFTEEFNTQTNHPVVVELQRKETPNSNSNNSKKNNASTSSKLKNYHHANGQPKLSHRVSKILNKLQRT